MKRAIISGIGIEIPQAAITNDELVASYNEWIDRENVVRVARGEAPLAPSDSEFIVYASGVKNRHVLVREGILDVDRMAPVIPQRADDELSAMAEFGVASARAALDHAGVDASDVDMVICSASHQQRPYPAIAIEIQRELGANGAAFDMGLGCSSAAAALHVASSLVRSGAQKRVLIVTPEIITGQLNFRDRQTHFIFGDASASMLIEAVDEGESRDGRFEIVDTRSWTQFSNNIRTNFGFLSRTA
ncbi:MAG: beta-ketoacyl-ACP synthase III, partial [Proteobacteria bacterium]|nr:beta-ketoacyl-ACP synthase III [Pseudomonadota bacterium]